MDRLDQWVQLGQLGPWGPQASQAPRGSQGRTVPPGFKEREGPLVLLEAPEIKETLEKMGLGVLTVHLALQGSQGRGGLWVYLGSEESEACWVFLVQLVLQVKRELQGLREARVPQEQWACLGRRVQEETLVRRG